MIYKYFIIMLVLFKISNDLNRQFSVDQWWLTRHGMCYFEHVEILFYSLFITLHLKNTSGSIDARYLSEIIICETMRRNEEDRGVVSPHRD